jgi:PGF-CTERM protein
MAGKASGRSVKGTVRRTGVLSIATLVVIAALGATGAIGAGLGAGIASAQAGGLTPIDSCTTIDRPGEYLLTTNITNTSADPCIAITASDVTLDGGGHTLAGEKPNYGIRVDNGDVPQSNVTVRNVAVDGWVRGISFMNATGGKIENTTATDSIEGYLVQESTDVVVRNNYAYDNSLGIHVRNAEGNLVRRNIANDNKWGIHLEFRANDNRVVENVARNNSEWDLISRLDSSNNVVSRLDIGSGTFSLVSTNVALKGTNATPDAPEGQTGPDSAVEIVGASSEDLDPSISSLSVHYRAASGNTSSLAIYRSDGGAWTELDSTVRPAENLVSTSNVTEFGTVAAFGAEGTTVRPVSLDAARPTLTRRSMATTTATATTTNTGTTATETSTSTDTNATPESTTTDASTTAGSGTTTRSGSTATDTTDASGTDTGTTTETTGPGFGLLVALIAVLVAALLATRRKGGR